MQNYRTMVQDGDMVLCRVNAPLVSQCFKFLKEGRAANILGRDMVQGLISTVKKSKATTVPEFITWLDNWLQAELGKEQAKRHPDENRQIALQDRHDCLVCFTDEATTCEDIIRKIESVFADKQCPTCKKLYAKGAEFCYECKKRTGKEIALTLPEGIRLSSIHKAKGLESKRVFLLRPKGAECPHPMARSAWQREQEINLLYVAITRAIEEIIYVQ